MTPSESAPSARLRVAVVGAGYVATHPLAALKQLDFVDVVGICDSQLAAAQALEHALAEDNPQAAAERIAAVADQTWDRRVDDVLAVVAQALVRIP